MRAAHQTSLAEKLALRIQSLPFAFERGQISSLVSEAQTFRFDTHLSDVAYWLLWHRTEKVETNLDAIRRLRKPIWIEFDNTVRTRHLPATDTAGTPPKRGGFLFAPDPEPSERVRLVVIYDDGTEGTMPFVSYAIGMLDLALLRDLAFGAQTLFHLTTEKCMRRMMDHVLAYVPDGFAQEMAEVSLGNDDIYTASVQSAQTDLVAEVPFALTCLLIAHCRNITSIEDDLQTVPYSTLAPARPPLLERLRLRRGKDSVGLDCVRPDSDRPLRLRVPLLDADWRLPSCAYASGTDTEGLTSSASNRPNEGAIISARSATSSDATNA